VSATRLIGGDIRNCRYNQWRLARKQQVRGDHNSLNTGIVVVFYIVVSDFKLVLALRKFVPLNRP
jgi:hypothetical protein